jgi:hypothetical protein
MDFFRAIVLSGLLTLPLQAQPTAEEISRYPHTEAQNVYRAVLDNVFRSDGRPRMIVVYDSLSHALAHIDTLKGGLSAFPSGFDIDAFRNFLRLTGTSFRPREGNEFAFGAFPRFSYAVPLSRISGDDFKEFRSSRHGDTVLVMRNGYDPVLIAEEPFWTAFRKRFPEAWGYSVFTRVGFNDELTHAFVQMMHRCYSDCRSIESLSLRKAGSRWIVENRTVHAESIEEFPPGRLRYVGKGGYMRTAALRFADSTRRARRDSIAMEALPRHIRGTVVNSVTGKGVDGFPIYSISVDGKPTKIAVTRNGRFHLRPATGGILFVLQCPNAPFDYVRNLDGHSFPVPAGLDTTVEMRITTLEPCSLPRRVRRMASGLLDSSAHVNSTFPSAEEALVYTGLLRTLFQGMRKPLLRSQSAARCGSYYTSCAASSSLLVLVREGVLDSTAVADFSTKGMVAEPLNPAFAARSGFQIITQDELEYLNTEAFAADPRRIGTIDPAQATWIGVAEAFEGASEIVAFTRVGFNASGNQALVTMRRDGPGLRTTDETYLLTRDAGEWIVIRRDVERTPVRAGIVDDQCAPMRGGRTFSAEELLALNGTYRVTLVESDGTTHREEFEIGTAAAAQQLRVRGYHLELRDASNGDVSGTWRRLGAAAERRDDKGNRKPPAGGHFCGYRLR